MPASFQVFVRLLIDFQEADAAAYRANSATSLAAAGTDFKPRISQVEVEISLHFSR